MMKDKKFIDFNALTGKNYHLYRFWVSMYLCVN